MLADFQQGFIMSRGHFNPPDFGVDIERCDFMDLMVDEFNAACQGMYSIDELVLHPQEAMRFCGDVRHKHGWLFVPDDIILRSVMNRRK